MHMCLAFWAATDGQSWDVAPTAVEPEGVAVAFLEGLVAEGLDGQKGVLLLARGSRQKLDIVGF